MIPDEILEKIIYAADASPVGMGKYENVHLSIITDKALLKAIEDNAAAALDAPGRSFLYGAPMLILVSANGDGNVAHSNAAIIVQDMVLEAVNCGAGCCHIWGCVMPLAKNAELTAKLGVPAGFTPVCGIALGLTDEKYETREIPAGRIGISRI